MQQPPAVSTGFWRQTPEQRQGSSPPTQMQQQHSEGKTFLMTKTLSFFTMHIFIFTGEKSTPPQYSNSSPGGF
jgi:hypothetical protein